MPPPRGEAAVRPSSTAFRPDIQGLRAVAVGTVVLSHAHVAGFAGGYVGVDVFFVISGFLITGLLLGEASRTGRVGIAGFYARRALRILPAATVVVLTTSVASVVVLNVVQARAVLDDSRWAALFLANVHFARLGTDYFAAGRLVSPLQHFWSLSVEEQFYLVWPAALAITLYGWRRRPRDLRRALLRGRVVLVLLVVFGASLAYSVHDTAHSPASAYFSTFARAWELATGALAAALLPVVTRLPARVRAGLGLAGLVAIAVAVGAYGPGTPFPGSAALLPVLGAAAVLVGGAGATDRGAAALLRHQPLRYLGDISYSLYLWHWPLLILAADRKGAPLAGWQTVLVVAVALVLSSASYHLVENPFRHAHRTWAASSMRALALWPVALTAVLVAALVLRPASPIGAATAPTSSGGNAPAYVAAAVAQADAGAPLPTRVAPAITAVNADFHSIGACSGYQKTTNEVCQLGDAAGSHELMVFGDSHTTMWIPAFEAIAQQQHLRFVPEVKESCRLADFVQTTDFADCHEWYAFALATIRAQHPSTVVLSDFREQDSTGALPALIRDLGSTGAKVVVMTDVPLQPQPPVECLLKSGATLRTCTFPDVDAAHDAAVTRVAQGAGARVVDVDPWFCADGQCPSLVDGIVLYTDDLHITGTYARFLTPDLAKALGPL